MLGALLMSVTSLQYAMLVDIVGAALAVMTLSIVKIPSPKSATGEKIRVLRDMKEGIRSIKSNAALMKVSVPVLLATFVFVPFGTLLPLMVKGYFGGTAWHNGIVQTMFSIGMLIAATIIGSTGGIKKQFLMISASIITLGVCSLAGGILPPSAFWVFCIVVFILGATGMCFNIPYTAYIQKTIPQENLGKVISLVTSVISFAAPVGMFIAGPLSEVIGVSNWMLWAGILVILVGIMCYMMTRKYDKQIICEANYENSI
jgi:DHA3 family macrolide efflux protein-like MFS transporter